MRERVIYSWCPGCGNIVRPAPRHYKRIWWDKFPDRDYWECGRIQYADEARADGLVRKHRAV
jgi:hypothetical protein